MNYEFHVGDYVETVDGRIGYIDGIYTLTDSISWICIHAKSNDQLGAYSQTFTPQSRVEAHFLRIGAYDFTKKEKKKIEPISDCNKHIFANAIKSDNQLVRTVSDDILNKINELVDAVNELRDKENDE